MTGPPYPPAPGPDSNAIGGFQVGVSPVGSIPPFDIWETIISQYANSPILTGIIAAFNAAMDLTEPFDDFYDMIWNVLTATGYGLDVWGRIVGVSRTLTIAGGPSGTFLGFEEASSWTGFGQGSFYSGAGGSGSGNNYTMSDAQYRQVILAKAATNICDGSIPAHNAILLALFPGRGACYVADGLNMTMTRTFEFALTPVELAVVSSAILPNPAGVVVSISQL